MKMPLPTNTASAPSCMTKLASAGVAMPPAEDFGFVNVVDAEFLQDLGFGEVADAAFGHHGDRHRGHNFANLFRRGHAGDAAFSADLRGHALEGHDGDGSGFFGNDGLLGVGDVHDDAALEHFGEAGLESERSGVATVVLGHVRDPMDTFSQSRRMAVSFPPSAL